jgi:short-subunit dehydrogenase
VARTADRLQALASELRDAHDVDARVIPCDLADATDRKRLFSEVEEGGKAVEILVNNAGFGIYCRFAESEREHELQQVRLNVEAVVDLSHRYLRPMLEQGRGAIVNLASTAGFQALPANGTYAATKSFVLLLSEALWAEARECGVTVTAVSPGPVRTEFQERNDARFADNLPGLVWCGPERVARDALRAAERGKRHVIPGGLPVRIAFGPNRRIPTALSLPVSKRLMESA